MNVATPVSGFHNTVQFRMSPPHVEDGGLYDFVWVTEYHAPSAVKTDVYAKPTIRGDRAALGFTIEGRADTAYALEQIGYTIDTSIICDPTEADLNKMQGLPQYPGRCAVAVFNAAGEMIGNYYAADDIFAVLYAYRNFLGVTRIVARKAV